MTNLNMFGPAGGMGGGGSVYGTAGGAGAPPSAFAGVGGAPPSAFAPMGVAGRPMSTFSMATTVNPFGGGTSPSTDPTDEELLSVLKHYLSTQDLMTVTKKTAREAVTARFPKADLTGRKDFLNQSIDQILSES
jgi:chitin synthase